MGSRRLREVNPARLVRCGFGTSLATPGSRQVQVPNDLFDVMRRPAKEERVWDMHVPAAPQ